VIDRAGVFSVAAARPAPERAERVWMTGNVSRRSRLCPIAFSRVASHHAVFSAALSGRAFRLSRDIGAVREPRWGRRGGRRSACAGSRNVSPMSGRRMPAGSRSRPRRRCRTWSFASRWRRPSGLPDAPVSLVTVAQAGSDPPAACSEIRVDLGWRGCGHGSRVQNIDTIRAQGREGKGR
jgi:hypothetical protein